MKEKECLKKPLWALVRSLGFRTIGSTLIPIGTMGTAWCWNTAFHRCCSCSLDICLESLGELYPQHCWEDVGFFIDSLVY